MSFEKIRRFLKKSKIVTKCRAHYVKKISFFNIWAKKNSQKLEIYRTLAVESKSTKIGFCWILMFQVDFEFSKNWNFEGKSRLCWPFVSGKFRPKKKIVEFNKMLKWKFSESKLCQKRCDSKKSQIGFVSTSTCFHCWPKENWLKLHVNVRGALPLWYIHATCLNFLLVSNENKLMLKKRQFVTFSNHIFSDTICFLKTFTSTFCWIRQISSILNENLPETRWTQSAFFPRNLKFLKI